MKRENTFKIYAVVFSLGLLFTLGSCKKLIEINPSSTQLLTSTVFTDSATVQSTLGGMYSTFGIQSGPYRLGLSTLPAFSADELQYVGTNFDNYANNAILSTDANVNSIWTNTYSAIYSANAIIEGVLGSSAISTNFKNQAMAEARFIRSFCYFYLINLYGDVPLILTTDVAKNITLPRTPVATVYAQIIEDLKFAQNNLRADYSISAGTRTRVNKWAATAMLARVYLYIGDWANAEAQASSVIGNTALFELNRDLNKVFVPTSKEAIFQLYNDNNGYTWYAITVLPNPVSKVPTYVFNPALTAGFETGDARKTAWAATLVYNGVTYTYPYKYKSITLSANAEYYTLLRLGEQFLIRAEARAQQGNINGAKDDLFAIRDRAGLGVSTATDKPSALLAVEQERRIELNNEWGHRWLDLKRTGRVNTVIKSLKPNFNPDAALYPIPNAQRLLNSSLTQNPGYN
ncbi:RagB/SusD family nutrient uptake outer membrane protein [Pedobacter sp. PWIIR3]